VIAAAFGIEPDPFGEYPHVVMKALDGDADMPFEALLHVAHLSFHPIESCVDLAETRVNLTETRVDAAKAPIDPPKPRIH
jgi:hypothetical protein